MFYDATIAIINMFDERKRADEGSEELENTAFF